MIEMSPILQACLVQPMGTITHINTNTLFSTDMDMPGDIHVHSEAELLIEAKIGMRQGTRILVERNARLVIDNGGVVTKGCDAPYWTGIQVLGNSQKAQPERFAPLTDPAQAGIVWIDNATVEWARCGVTAGGGYDPEAWGGLVWTNNATFRNNRKDVEFMSYKFTTNRSRFFNTTFTEIDEAFANTEGVTIWETDDIEFHNCTFKNLDYEGIRTYDAGMRVLNNNKFEDNETGITSYATYPMANKLYIGSGTGTENKFVNNQYHINVSLSTGFFGSLSNGIFSLDVINNDFSGGQYGVVVEGASNFRIAGNLLTGVPIGGWVSNTGFNNVFNQNFIGCNTFAQGTNHAIIAIGENKHIQFLANDFRMAPGSSDFALLNSFFPFLNGTIRATQGNKDVPASNCFSDPGTQIDIQTWGSTDPFTYFYLAGDPPPDCDPEPLNPGNYSKQLVITPIFGVLCEQFGGLPDGLTNPTPGDLDARRTTLQQLTPYIATDANAKHQYYQTLQEKDAILQYLLEQAVSAQQHITAEGLLAGEQSKSADWAIFGLRMGRKDYANAALWLSQLPIQSDEDVKFRDVQIINLQRLQAPGTFQLSPAQESFLSSVAESTSPVRGYARGILGLLKDRRFYPEEIEIGGERNPPSKTGAMAQNAALRIFPVPASGALSVSWPSLPAESDVRLLVYDIYGGQHLSEQIVPLESQRTIETGLMPVGVYFLVISDKGRPVHRAKFTVQH